MLLYLIASVNSLLSHSNLIAFVYSVSKILWLLDASFTSADFAYVLTIVCRHYNELLNLKMNWQRNLGEALKVERLVMRLRKLVGKIMVKVYQIFERSMKESLLHIKEVGMKYVLYAA